MAEKKRTTKKAEGFTANEPASFTVLDWTLDAAARVADLARRAAA